MDETEMINVIIEEMNTSVSRGYLSSTQFQIVKMRLEHETTYRQLVSIFKLSGRTPLSHCIKRTCLLELWSPGMPGIGSGYLSKYDLDLFFQIIGEAADESNCIPAIYAISLAHYLKKSRNSKAFHFLCKIGCNFLANDLTETAAPTRSWLNNVFEYTDFHIVSGQQIEYARRMYCDVPRIFFYFQLHSFLFQRDPALIINMDETMLTSKKRFKVLARIGKLPLIPDALKLPHLTGCVAFSASGHVFKPLIILPNKKTLRTLEEFNGKAFFASSDAGWMTQNIFIYFSLLLVCQLSHYRLTLPDSLRHQRIILLVDGHKSRESFTAALIFYLFDIDLVLLPPHTSHLMQAFDVSVASPLKSYFKKELTEEKYDEFLANGFTFNKETAQKLRSSLIRAFLNAMAKSATLSNIESGFRKSGIVPININEPLSSQFAMMNHQEHPYDDQDLLRNYWLNTEEGLNELFLKNNDENMGEDDFSIDLKDIASNLKNSSVADGLSLSDLPPLFVEEEDIIKRIDLNQ